MVTIEELLKQIEKLQKRIEALEAENAELRARLAKYEKDSGNSSKPPSQDFKKNKNLPRVKSFRNPGGQIGHQGKTREQVLNPDEIIDCNPDKCLNCGTELVSVEGSTLDTRQEIDITMPEPKVTEYRRIKKICPVCKKENQGQYLEHLKSPVQIGNNTKAAVIYFHVCHKIPFERLTKITSDLLHFKISEGTVENALQKALKQADVNRDEILQRIKQSSWVQGDETGIRVDGTNWQLWTWCNNLFSIYFADKSRSYEVIKENFGEDYQGTLIHDCYAAQNKTPAKAHQHCHAHYQRELKYCIQQEGSQWSQSMSNFLKRSVKMRDKIWQKNFDLDLRNQVIKKFEQILINLLRNSPLVADKESHKLYKRFLKHSDKVLTFMKHPDLPATNNGAERAIRNAKIHKKVSGGFRNPDAARRYASILSTVETAKKQGLSILYACRSLILGQELAFQG